jgi:helix-turn-helix protein
VDLRGASYNTNLLVDELQRLVKRLPDLPSPMHPTAPPLERTRSAKHLNPAETEHLIAGYQAGATLRELGAWFGIHPATAGSVLKRNGVQRRRTGLSAEQQVEAERLYATGQSLRRIGDRFGVDGETVRRVLIGRGTPIRTPSGASR